MYKGEKMKIGIIGSRRRDSNEDLNILVNKFVNYCRDNDLKQNEVTIVSGGCKKGGDRFAEIIAGEFKLPIILHLPDKTALPENPQRWDFAKINFDRNTKIANDSHVLIAMVAPDRLGGTEDTIKKFLKHNKTCNLILI
jgi:hypothetical protein